MLIVNMPNALRALAQRLFRYRLLLVRLFTPYVIDVAAITRHAIFDDFDVITSMSIFRQHTPLYDFAHGLPFARRRRHVCPPLIRLFLPFFPVLMLILRQSQR